MARKNNSQLSEATEQANFEPAIEQYRQLGAGFAGKVEAAFFEGFGNSLMGRIAQRVNAIALEDAASFGLIEAPEVPGLGEASTTITTSYLESMD